MATIVTPSIRKIYKDLIKQVVADLHKPIFVYLEPDKEDCPNCIYDRVNNKSSGKFDTSFIASTVVFGATITPTTFSRSRCPICYGVGYLENENVRNVKALVRWNPGGADNLEILPVGREGHAVVRIKTLYTNYDTVVGAAYFLVEGVRCEIIQPPTIRGLGVQEEMVVAFLQEVEPGTYVKK